MRDNKKTEQANKTSSRHAKISGNFGENLILYWLSKHSFECARVDHVGIDLIAKNPHTEKLMGISVKSRTWDDKTTGSCINISEKHFENVEVACKAFHCKPYFAFVVDQASTIYGFITSKSHLHKLYPTKETTKLCYWRMSKLQIANHRKDQKVKMFQCDYETLTWWPTEQKKAEVANLGDRMLWLRELEG